MGERVGVLKVYKTNLIQTLINFGSLSLSSVKVQVFGAQWDLTLCYSMDSSRPRDSPGNTGVGCHFLLQGIFLAQGSNSGLLHCTWILYRLSHQGSQI